MLRGELRAMIRGELNDTGGTPLWGDALLNEWINEAIRGYARELPEEASITIVAVAGQESYALPARFLQVMRVEQPKTIVRRPGTPSRTLPGDAVDFQGRVGRTGVWAYRMFAGSLILDPAPIAIGADEDIRFEYLRAYAEPAADGDVLATPAMDDEVLIQLTCARALRWIGTDESKRARFERDRGASPMAQAEAYEQAALRLMATRQKRVRAGVLQA